LKNGLTDDLLIANGLTVGAHWVDWVKQHGYWFNLDNAPQAAACYEAFRGWSAKEGLRWAAVGLDIEPDMRVLERLLHDRWRLLGALVARMFGHGRNAGVPWAERGSKCRHLAGRQ